MPTKKPRIQSILETDTYYKLQKLCELDGRSESQMTKRIIEKYIQEFEQEHGEIKFGEQTTEFYKG